MTILRIFVSYEATDTAFATQLMTNLREVGAEVLTDNTSLDGIAFKQSLAEELSHCQHLVVIQTLEALQSPRVQAIVDTALKQVQEGQMAEVLRVIAPTLNAVETREVPTVWASTLEFDASQDYPRALAKLSLHLGLIDIPIAPSSPASSMLTTSSNDSQGRSNISSVSDPFHAQGLDTEDHLLRHPHDLQEIGNVSPVSSPPHAQRLNIEDRPPRRFRYPYTPFRSRSFVFSLAIGLALIAAGVVTASILPMLTHVKPQPTTTLAATTTPTSTPTPVPTPTPTPTPRSSPIPPVIPSNISPTAPPISWITLLNQAAPDCNNPSGTLWNPIPTTIYRCLGNGLLMQRAAGGYFPEIDLDNVQGTLYDQTKFLVQTQATFQNPGDTSTSAALLVQTPQTPSILGGYIFAINSRGLWQLKEVKGAVDMPVIRSGTVSMDLAHPTTITVKVLNSNLYCAINNTWLVVSLPDNLNPAPGAVSLMVINDGSGSSSPIVFSNFELDK